MPSAYHRIGRLATHPSFDRRRGCLHCRCCGEDFGRVPAFEAHFLAHAPAPEAAFERLSGKGFVRAALVHGWLDACGHTGAVPTPANRWGTCPRCGAVAGIAHGRFVRHVRDDAMREFAAHCAEVELEQRVARLRVAAGDALYEERL